MKITSVLSIFTFIICTQASFAQEETSTVDPAAFDSSLIQDFNGDGIIRIDAFGDSITRGVGDFSPVGAFVEESPNPEGEAGYPLRLERILRIPVSNLGRPGERIVLDGLFRFASTFPGRDTDVVILSGGTNDAIDQTFTSNFQRAMQAIINISYAEGAQVVLVSPPPTCCNNSELSAIVNGFSETIKTLAAINDLPLANVRKGFQNTCGALSGSCFLLDTPEGIHPNIAGYDVMSEVILSALFNIDIFAPGGNLLLEQTLGLEEGSTLTMPDIAPASPVVITSTQ